MSSNNKYAIPLVSGKLCKQHRCSASYRVEALRHRNVIDNKKITERGARTLDHQVKSLTLYRLSQSGLLMTKRKNSYYYSLERIAENFHSHPTQIFLVVRTVDCTVCRQSAVGMSVYKTSVINTEKEAWKLARLHKYLLVSSFCNATSKIISGAPIPTKTTLNSFQEFIWMVSITSAEIRTLILYRPL